MRLLEREAELEKPRARRTRGRGGPWPVGTGRGEAGIGKTSLVRALRERMGDRVAVLIGACEPLTVPAPLKPLREVVDGVGSTALKWEDPDRLRLAQSVLDAVGQRAPVVAMIEDAYWADPTTIDVVRLVARRLEERPIAAIVTYRDDSHLQDETFYLLDGEVTVWLVEPDVPTEPADWLRTRARRCCCGDAVFAPAGTPHTFRAESDAARMLVLSTPPGIEDYVRALSEPAQWPWLQPPPDGPAWIRNGWRQQRPRWAWSAMGPRRRRLSKGAAARRRDRRR